MAQCYQNLSRNVQFGCAGAIFSIFEQTLGPLEFGQSLEISGDLQKIRDVFAKDLRAREQFQFHQSWHACSGIVIMAFHQFRHEFSRTVAASSAVQWILSIGDRHAENNLLSKTNGGLLPFLF